MNKQMTINLPGSDRLWPTDVSARAAPADRRVEATVVLRRRAPLARAESPGSIDAAVLPQVRHDLTRSTFAEAHGAYPDDVAKVEAMAQEHGLDVVEVSLGRRRIVLSGTVAAMNEAFGVDLQLVTLPGKGEFTSHQGPVRASPSVAPMIEAVLGLDSRPLASPHFRSRRADTSASFKPTTVAELYDFPAGLDGSGQCVAVLEFGGGYRAKDLSRYFAGIGVAAPHVTAVSVDGAHNNPTNDPDGPDGEVVLDIEMVGAVASGARIAVYFAPNTDRGFVDALTAAIHDSVRRPSVVAISWGAPESAWSPDAMAAFDGALQDAAALGVTVCVASGDNGSSDSVKDNKLHVDFPASSPYALACGGTTLKENAGAIASEVVWNNPGGGASGGGVSDVFPLPPWQATASVPAKASGGSGRGVPDVAGNADPNTGYDVLVDGAPMVIGGTSAVAPLWAGLIARLNQRIGKPVGYINPILYQKLSKGLHDIVDGDNGYYKAGPRWDACTGLGSPDGGKLLALLNS